MHPLGRIFRIATPEKLCLDGETGEAMRGPIDQATGRAGTGAAR
jgi:hypothetical protein